MPLTVNVDKASFTVSGPEWEPKGAVSLRSDADRRWWWKTFGDWCLAAKRRELRRNRDVKGKPFRPIKYKRPDGAKGPPLSPHQAGSRFQKWARVVGTSRQFTIFWSHGWAKVVGAHAWPRMRPGGWALPKRDAVGLTNASLKWAHELTLGAWRHRLGTGAADVRHIQARESPQKARGKARKAEARETVNLAPQGPPRAARAIPRVETITGARPARVPAVASTVRVFTGTSKPRLGRRG